MKYMRYGERGAEVLNVRTVKIGTESCSCGDSFNQALLGRMVIMNGEAEGGGGSLPLIASLVCVKTLDTGPSTCAILCPCASQICLQMGFDREEPWLYLCGDKPELLEVYPELGYLRDIVYLLKAFMAPTSDALPEVTRTSKHVI